MKMYKTLNFSMLLFCWSMYFFFLGYMYMKSSSTMIYEFELFNLSSVSFTFSLILDKISVSFSMVVTLISGSVFFFSNKYMEEDPFSTRFIWVLLSFVVSMNLLIFSGSIFFVLLGWDGLGITSFALIIYYESGESQMAGFQTLMINRVGDVLILLSFYLLCCSGQFTIFSMGDKLFYLSGVVVLLCVAALTKSAQFPFSSWLPAAMAAPTPVSALVHSSTLVTAGIYLVIRLCTSLPLSINMSSLMMFCGSVTCLLGGWAATYENDIKKVIALSTLSQLGVMVFSLGMNMPSLALFHLYTHALFKALLFLAAGHILLMTFGNQDLRFVGGLGLSMPFTSLMFTVSSLCLIGAPFMSAFYSKHLILELMLYQPINCISVLLMMLATFMTAKYVFRTLKGVVWGKTGTSMISGCSNVFSFFPVLVLGSGAIVGGNFISMVDISVLEYVFLPSLPSGLINVVTLMGVIMGLGSLDLEKKNYTLSTLFFLTPLVYGSPKIFSGLVKAVGVLDYGWMEPYYVIKKKLSWSGSMISTSGIWPGTRLLVSLFSVSVFLMYVTVFAY